MGALVFVPPRLVIEVTEQRTSNGWAASAYDEPIILPPSDVNLQETSILQQPAVLVDAGMAVGDTVTQKDMATRHQTRIDPLKDFGVTGADLLGSLGKTSTALANTKSPWRTLSRLRPSQARASRRSGPQGRRCAARLGARARSRSPTQCLGAKKGQERKKTGEAT